jgi:DNA gyrase/topoisomerase IV subunit A
MIKEEFVVSPQVAKVLSDIQQREEDFIKGKSIKVEEWDLEDIQKEYELILKKESKLSSNNRKKILEIINQNKDEKN